VIDEYHAACLRATGLLELGLPEEALEELDELAAQQRDSSVAVHLRVDALFRLKKWAEAVALCLPKLDAEPGDPGWWIQAAFATRRADCVEQAEPILRQALEHHPRHGLILYNLACYACVQGREEEARQLLVGAMTEDRAAYSGMALADPDLTAVHAWLLEHLAAIRDEPAKG
jgi:Flp pilus assembly protein TadD